MSTAPNQAENNELVVRQHERYACELPARVRVAAENAGQVVLSRSVGDGNGCINATIVDCSTGGLGLRMPVYLPRGCRVDVQVPGAPGQPDVFRGVVRVQRATMLERTPTYYLGGSLLRDSAGGEVARLLAHARAAGGGHAQ